METSTPSASLCQCQSSPRWFGSPTWTGSTTGRPRRFAGGSCLPPCRTQWTMSLLSTLANAPAPRGGPSPATLILWGPLNLAPTGGFLLTGQSIAAHSPQDTAIALEEDTEVLGQGHMTWQQLWFYSTWKDQVNVQDTYRWETILKSMLKISNETREDLTFRSRTTVPVFSSQTDIMMFDFCIQNINFCNFFMRVLKMQRLLGHPITTRNVNLEKLTLMFKVGQFRRGKFSV